MPFNPQKILIIQSELLHYRVPLYNHLGGTGHYNVTVLHSGKPVGADALSFKEIVTPVRAARGLYYRGKVPHLAREYDLIIGMFDFRWLSLLQLFYTRRDLPFVWWGIGFGRNHIYDRFRVHLIRKSEGGLFYGERAREWYIEQGIDPAHLFVAPNTIFVAEPFVNSEPAQRTHFLFVGSLHQRKRLDLLMQAFAAVSNQVPDYVKLDVVGAGSEEHSLRSLVQELNLEDKVTLHGQITDNDELRRFFYRALAVVSPGQAGLAVLHSFAHGVPFVTMKNAISGTEIDNIEHGVNGFLYDGQTEQLSQYLLHLAKQPENAVRMGIQAHRHYVQHRTMSHMVAGFERVIEYALSKADG